MKIPFIDQVRLLKATTGVSNLMVFVFVSIVFYPHS